MGLDVASYPGGRFAIDQDGDAHTNGSEFLNDTVDAITAAGSNQGNAAAIGDGVSIVSGADGTKGVVLPAASAGRVRSIYNANASNGLKVYPASGDDINDGSTDAAITIAPKTRVDFHALDTSTWAATSPGRRAGAAQAAVDATASTQTTPYGFATQAQADAIVTLVNELRAALIANGTIKGDA